MADWFEIRAERQDDHDRIRAVVAAAFGSDGEADLVDRIRGSPEYVSEMALVAECTDGRAGEIVGHVIFNGQRAYADSNFAALGDGAYYELFPTLFFPDPDMQHALDPNWPFSLFNVRPWFRTVNGGPYIVLSSIWNTTFVDNNHVCHTHQHRGQVPRRSPARGFLFILEFVARMASASIFTAGAPTISPWANPWEHPLSREISSAGISSMEGWKSR